MEKQNLVLYFNFAAPYGISWWEGIKQDTTCTPEEVLGVVLAAHASA